MMGFDKLHRRQHRLANAGEAMRDLYAHRESQRLIDQTRENTDSENNHDKLFQPDKL